VAGIVKDSGGMSLSNVEVMLMRTGRTVRTDSVGHFLLAAIPSGQTDVGFRRVAFEPVIVTLRIPTDDTTEVEVRLGGITPLLPAVIVNDHVERNRVLEQFEARRKLGAGYFVTRADIERRRPSVLSDYMRMVPGVRIVTLDNGRTALRFARNPRGNCPPQYFVDGIPTSNFDIDEVLPGDVEGVELYGGAAGVPPQYNRFNCTSICGTILIWTRIPGKENEKS
jgi:carboxypeptidase family protein/TonB-dependent receptor-like protein